MSHFIPITGSFVQLRIPKNPTAKQVQVIARRVEWLLTHPGTKYPADLKEQIIELKLYSRYKKMGKQWIAHFDEPDAVPIDEKSVPFKPLMALAEVAAAECKMESTSEHLTDKDPLSNEPLFSLADVAVQCKVESTSENVPAVETLKFLVDEPLTFENASEDDPMENSSNARMEAPKVIIPRMLMAGPSKSDTAQRKKEEAAEKSRLAHKRIAELGDQIRNKDPCISIIDGTGVFVRVKRDGKRLSRIWWCKECEKAYSMRSPHLKARHPAEYDVVMRNFNNSPHAASVKVALSKRWNRNKPITKQN